MIDRLIGSFTIFLKMPQVKFILIFFGSLFLEAKNDNIVLT
jgi:hypothetical protein